VHREFKETDMKRRAMWTGVVALIAATAVAGCGGSQESNTTCSTFAGESLNHQKAVLTHLLKDHGQSTSPLTVDTTLISARGYCLIHDGNDKIGGIFPDN
jgi:hypothetical protein